MKTDQLWKDVLSEVKKVQAMEITGTHDDFTIHKLPPDIVVSFIRADLITSRTYEIQSTYHYSCLNGEIVHFIPTATGCYLYPNTGEKKMLDCICWHKSRNGQWVRSQHKVGSCQFTYELRRKNEG